MFGPDRPWREPLCRDQNTSLRFICDQLQQLSLFLVRLLESEFPIFPGTRVVHCYSTPTQQYLIKHHQGDSFRLGTRADRSGCSSTNEGHDDQEIDDYRYCCCLGAAVAGQRLCTRHGRWRCHRWRSSIRKCSRHPNAGSAGAGTTGVSGIPAGPASVGGTNNSINDPSGIGNAAKIPPPATSPRCTR